MKRVIIIIIALCIAFPSMVFAARKFGENRPVDQKRWVSKHDGYFRKYTKRYFGPGFDWKWFKAQGIAESNLDEMAESWVGAKGVMQVMPATFKEIRGEASWIGGIITDPRWNIAAGIHYDHKLYRSWKSERPFNDRMAFVFASYNGGMGNVLKAQKKCVGLGIGDCNLWRSIEQHANRVSTWRYEESLGYVAKIFKFMGVEL